MIDAHRFVLAFIHLISAVLFTPLLLRIFYVLLSNEYRKYECYRIMAQVVFLYVICGFCYVFYGLGVVLNSAIWELVKAAHFIRINAFICIVIISFVLAINRIDLICHLRFPRCFSPILQITTWLVFVALIGVMYSPLSQITLGADYYTVTYEKTRWFSANFGKIRFYFSLILIASTLGIYVVITSYVLYRKCIFNSNTASKAEMKVGIQAGLTFLSNFFNIMVYMFLYEYVKKSPWSKDAFALSQMANFLVLPVVVFLGFNTKLRHQVFFYKRKSISVIHGVTNILVASSR